MVNGEWWMANSELGIVLFLLAPADCLLLTACCLLRLRGVGVGRTLGRYYRLRQDVTADRERKSS
jgi:hypothetical protein